MKGIVLLAITLFVSSIGPKLLHFHPHMKTHVYVSQVTNPSFICVPNPVLINSHNSEFRLHHDVFSLLVASLVT